MSIADLSNKVGMLTLEFSMCRRDGRGCSVQRDRSSSGSMLAKAITHTRSGAYRDRDFETQGLLLARVTERL